MRCLHLLYNTFIYTFSDLLPGRSPSEECQTQCTNNAQSHNSPASPNNLLIRHCRTCIPNQVSQSVKAVEGKWEGEERFKTDFREDGKGRKAGCESRRFEMPAKDRGDEVCGSESVD